MMRDHQAEKEKEEKETSEAQTNGQSAIYRPNHPVRIVTAASLFDGHDASINIMRRILQQSGAEVIHLGHNRSVQEIVDCAIQEDAQGIAVSSYQGGHMEYFMYMIDLLRQKGATYIRVFGGGGGVIVNDEIQKLHEYGVSRIFSVDDGATMGLQGMINRIMEECDFSVCDATPFSVQGLVDGQHAAVARAISAIENHRDDLLQFDGTRLVAADGSYVQGRLGDTNTSADNSNLPHKTQPVIGITGTGGAGKSSLTDELVLRFLETFPDRTISILSVDPTKMKTGGALLGDRIRMNSIDTPRVYMRSMATRSSHSSVSDEMRGALEVCKVSGADLIILETSGIGQSGAEIIELCDIPIYVMTHEYGAATQLEKINMLDLADLVVLNKFEKRGSQDALRDIRKQMQRNRGEWHTPPEQMPVFPTIASQFHDEGVNRLFSALVKRLQEVTRVDGSRSGDWTLPDDAESVRGEGLEEGKGMERGFEEGTGVEKGTPTAHGAVERISIIPGSRERYLSEIATSIREYHRWSERQVEIATALGEIQGTIRQIQALEGSNEMDQEATAAVELLRRMEQNRATELDSTAKEILENWDQTIREFSTSETEITVRDRKIRQVLAYTSLSGLPIPRIALPKTSHPGERLRFALRENLPGRFPFTAGVFPLKRQGEDPTRMFAGEGTPEQTNRRFHYLSEGMPAARLSTAFDSVTLYGEDPDLRPDIYGKIGNSGVSICTLDDMKKLYSGFRLTDPSTSVSMTINGPAPMILAMFMNTAIDQEVEIYLKEQGRWEEARKKMEIVTTQRGTERSYYDDALPSDHNQMGLGTLGFSGDELVSAEEYEAIKERTLKTVRGTVQADILKEDQAQNTCIYSTEFALRMMGDIQQYFTTHEVRNYYSVSISGYHIAEAGANPVTQAAFTLANGFTYVEYYLSRGIQIDDFAHNLSFFFSNGLDPEYAVIGRVARRIWAIAMRDRYGANERSQKLKYHIQTSGRSLHAKEIQFNDIRTTLQALMAIYDNCNSLHTNAFDEAITTPTEASVRRALAIQLIINKEMGLAKNENPLQGSFIIEELTDLVEEAILTEFDRLTDRGGVLGAMERMYQRSKIQEESLFYETKKHTGELPVIGVNTFLSGEEEETGTVDLIRSGEREKQQQIEHLKRFQQSHADQSAEALEQLKIKAKQGENIFEELMKTVKTASLGQISASLYEIGGKYRRNM